MPKAQRPFILPIKQKKGKKVNFLFDSGSSVNVIPLNLIKRLGAKYDKLIESDFNQFTSCNNSQVRIIGHCNLNVIFQDKINRSFLAYISPNIYENIISLDQMLDWGLTYKGFPFKSQPSLNQIKNNKLGLAQASSSKQRAPAHITKHITTANPILANSSLSGARFPVLQDNKLSLVQASSSKTQVPANTSQP